MGRYKDKTVWEIRKCEICSIEFEVYKKNKKKYCSKKCANSDIRVKNKIKISQRKTYIKKYGVTHPMKLEETKNKFKRTMFRKYGTAHALQNKNIMKKMQNTVYNKYGTNNVFKSDIIIKKIKQIKLDRYKDKAYNNNKKSKQTCLLKYGVDSFSKTNEFKRQLGKRVYDKLLNSSIFNQIIIPEFTAEEYNGADKIYKFKCKKCNSIFKDHLDNGRIPRCLICYPLKSTSLAEKEIVEYIKQLLPDIDIIENDRIILNGKELDIYIPSKKLAIEYNGLYWHSELHGKDKNYHLNKTKMCNDKNIRLIQIFGDEWIYKQKIVKQRLKYIFGLVDKKIYARKCIIKEILANEKNKFLNEIHIQGEDKAGVKLGAFYNDELVSVMTFSKKRIALGSKNKNDNEYELSRFATKYSVIGIASKLLTYFIKTYKPESIISYSDNRWNTGKLYDNIGFTKFSNGTPGYWYIENGQRIHRFNFRKDQLKNKLKIFDNNLTEWQNMQLNGYDRIWDCGHNKYKLTIN